MKVSESTTRAITATWTEDECSRFLLAFDRWQAGATYDEKAADEIILINFYNDMSEALGEE